MAHAGQDRADAAYDSTFLDTLAHRVVLADGAMGTMLQAADLVLDDFAGLEGCNEILNVTRPDVVRSIHRGYLEAGADAVETNTFGANLPNLNDYDIADRIFELSEKGAALAREVAEARPEVEVEVLPADLGDPEQLAVVEARLADPDADAHAGPAGVAAAQWMRDPSGTSASGASRMTSPASLLAPTVSTSERNGPICRGGKLTTAATWRPTRLCGV
jgi:hypothetical protein